MVNSRPDRNGMLLIMLICTAMAAISAHAFAQMSLLEHPVFAKYPSSEELQRRIEQFRREHPDEFAGARADFDTAIRFLHNQPPPSARDIAAVHGKVPHRIHRWRLQFPHHREWLLQHEAEQGGNDGTPARVLFVREHIDELTVDFSLALRMVALDVILNGWDDWSAWTTDRLKGYRKRYPDIYRIVAVNLRGQLNHELWQRKRRGEPTADLEVDDGLRAQGLFLRMLMETEASEELRRHIRSQAKKIHADLDALDFVVKLALVGESRADRRNNGRSCMGSLTESLPLDQQRDFWVQYLDSDDFSIRSYAVSRVGISINLLKKDPQEPATNRQLAERLRKIAASDPDSRIRHEAQRRVAAYEDDSPPPGLIDYGKGKKDD